MKKYSLFCVILLVGTLASAQDNPEITNSQSVVVKQIDVENQRVVAVGKSNGKEIAVGEKFVATKGGQNCFFVVSSIKNNLIQLNGNNCSFIEKIAVGQTLEPSLFEDSAPTSKPSKYLREETEHPKREKKETQTKIGVSAYYGAGGTFVSSNIQLSGGTTGSGSGNLGGTGAPGLSIDVTHSPERGWGWLGGVSYDFPRTINTANINIGGDTFSETSPYPTISFLTIYGNALYSWRRFYIPFGLNYTIPSFQSGSSTNGSMSVGGYPGTQVGFGFYITDNFVAEAWLQDLNFTANESNSGVSINYNTLVLINPELKIKYLF